MRAVKSRVLLFVAAIATSVTISQSLIACGGGRAVAPGDGGDGTTGSLAGFVHKGPVGQGTVTAYRLSAQGVRGDSLATTKTDDSGAFSLGLPSYQGAIAVVASSGSYVDEALGFPVRLDGYELVAIVPDYAAGTAVDKVLVTPVSTWATNLALYHVTAKGERLSQALGDAYTHLNMHFGGLDWRSTVPADVTKPGPSGLAPETLAGLFLAALSAEAKQICVDANLTPGVSVNAATLTFALSQDLVDGTFDGKGANGIGLKQATYALDSQTLRQKLAQAMTSFLASDRNAHGFTVADLKPTMTALANNTDPYLFCQGQLLSAACSEAQVDTDPPAITIVTPAEGAGVHGQVPVKVTAQDAHKIASLTFSAPASLATAAPVLSAGDTQGTLEATLDVSAIPDGPLTITAAAADEFGNKTSKSVQVVVANHGPQIQVSFPNANQVIKGTVTLLATAHSQSGTVAKLELKNPPPGVGADQMPAADTLAVNWDSTKALEGALVLTFHAEDNFGTPSDLDVPVTVDNVPPGLIHVALSAGAPIQGANIEVYALDDATGEQLTTRPGGALLGTGGPTDKDGKATVTLTGENFSGPIQIRASGSGLSFLDPSDGSTTIAVPATFTMSSTISSYTTGAEINAPLTLWTTLADAAASAYARGRNPAHPGAVSVSQALTAVDSLFVKHLSSTTWNLRSTVPVSLTQPPTQSLRDAVFAALPDVALNQLARKLSLKGGLNPGQVVTAVSLAIDLVADLGADGQFDGKATNGQLSTPGNPPYSYAANTTRLDLAVALSDWLAGSTNKSGLGRPDLQNATVFDTICNDVSVLYPASQPPEPFDNVPPVVTFTVSFLGSDRAVHPAVGASNLVAGNITIVADATDPSGVASLSISFGGTALFPEQGSTASHVIVKTFPTVDGPLDLTAIATDAFGNKGTTPLRLTVDNTQPEIAVASPTANAYYANNIPVDATATDLNGVVSLTSTILPSGCSVSDVPDTDLTPARFQGLAGIDVLCTDGQATVVLTSCDPVFNCGLQRFHVNIDRTPPVVSVVTAPPQWASTSPAKFVVSATDAGAGVLGVFARGPDGILRKATLGLTGWEFTVPLGDGPNTFAVWATDAVGNSGEGFATYSASVTTTYDRTPPAITVEARPSYYDETGIQYAAGGAAPISYTYASATKASVVAKSTVHKVSTRISGGATAPTASDLETNNVTNIPYISLLIPTAATESPLTSVAYSLAIDVPRTAGQAKPPQPSGGTLLRSARTTASQAVYLLPLTRETLLPASLTGFTGYSWLGSSNAGVSVVATITVTDAAGNVGTLDVPFTYQILGPPIVLANDSTYATSLDPRNTRAYKLSDGTYGGLFTSNAAWLKDPNVRLDRWTVKNPLAVDIFYQPTTAAPTGWKMTEAPRHSVKAYPTSNYSYMADGYWYNSTPNWLVTDLKGYGGYYYIGAPGWSPPFENYPCGMQQYTGLGGGMAVYPSHTLNTAAQYDCRPTSEIAAQYPPGNPAGVPNTGDNSMALDTAASSSYNYRVYYQPLYGGGETTYWAPRTQDPTFTCPPCPPGQMFCVCWPPLYFGPLDYVLNGGSTLYSQTALYLTRPFTTARTATVPLSSFQAGYPNLTGNWFGTWRDFWWLASWYLHNSLPYDYAASFQAYRELTYISAASEVLNVTNTLTVAHDIGGGNFAYATYPLSTVATYNH